MTIREAFDHYAKHYYKADCERLDAGRPTRPHYQKYRNIIVRLKHGHKKPANDRSMLRFLKTYAADKYTFTESVNVEPI
jgi:hypothetical protein